MPQCTKPTAVHGGTVVNSYGQNSTCYNSKNEWHKYKCKRLFSEH